MPASLQHFFRKMQNLKLRLVFGGLPALVQFHFSKCIRQCGKESPFHWNYLLLAVMVEVIAFCRSMSDGVQSGARRWTHSIVADNVWLLATSREMITVMFTSLAQTMHTYKLDWKRSSLEDMIAYGCDSANLQIDVAGMGRYKLIRVHQMPILGVTMREYGDSFTIIRRRIEQAAKACCASLPDVVDPKYGYSCAI